jgi:hypothetical protein
MRKHGTALRPDPYYDYPRCRRALRRRGIIPRIARRGIESSKRLGRHRYVVERSLAWLVGYRRLQVRYERRSDLLLGFLNCPGSDGGLGGWAYATSLGVAS